MLPPEIILDIALRLPVKTIGRFRCVSKPWRYLLTQPQFIKDHLRRNKQYPAQESLLLLCFSWCYNAPLSNAYQLHDEITSFPLNLSFKDYTYLYCTGFPCSDGLLLLKNYDNKMVLVNPTMRVFKELPISPFALESWASSTLHGLGYDSVTDDYKVVTLSYYDTDTDTDTDDASYVDEYEYEDDDVDNEPHSAETFVFVNVYSVNNGTWRKVESPPYNHGGDEYDSSGVFVGGCIHWLASRIVDGSPVIVAFDLAKEQFREVLPPRSVNGIVLEVPPLSSIDEAEYVYYRLVVLGDCLCLFVNCAFEIDIWMMKDYGVEKSWTLFTLSSDGYSDYRPLCMWANEEVVMVENENSFSQKLVKYNLKEKTFNEIKVNGIMKEFSFGAGFVETLVSPLCRMAE